MILFQLLLLLIIIVCVYYIFIIPLNKIENYDGRISGINKEMCGKFCTETVGCQAFGYDNINNKCYLSERPILYQPAGSIYSQEYDIDQSRCNKIDPIREDIDDINNLDDEELRRNMLYSCQEMENGDYNFYKISNGNIEHIVKTNTTNDTMANSFMKTEYEKYPLFRIKWPNYRKDLNINDMYNKERNKLDNYTIFEKSNKEFMGEYLYPYECVKDIPENICVQSCAENENCAGIEYNPNFHNEIIDKNIKNNYKSVCCLKKTVGESYPRRENFKNGYFYVKKNPNIIKKDQVYIVNH